MACVTTISTMRRGRRAWRMRGICVYNFGDGGGFFAPPFGQRISRPPYSKYIATHTENTKNPKTLGKLLTQVNLTSHTLPRQLPK